jgi:hypothetical protein
MPCSIIINIEHLQSNTLQPNKKFRENYCSSLLVNTKKSPRGLISLMATDPPSSFSNAMIDCHFFLHTDSQKSDPISPSGAKFLVPDWGV